MLARADMVVKSSAPARSDMISRCRGFKAHRFSQVEAKGGLLGRCFGYNARDPVSISVLAYGLFSFALSALCGGFEHPFFRVFYLAKFPVSPSTV